MLRMADDRAAIAHLLRRATFGPAPGQVESLNAAGLAAALDQVLNAAPPALPAAPNLEGWDQPIWWMLRMSDPAVGLAEKMTWFWHAHLCTSVDKVGSWFMMWNQHMLLRNNALGNFRTLLQQLTIDPAMLIYLDGDPSVVTAPNENYSREVMELFAMGPGNYTETDVRNGAKALAGWDVNWETGVATFYPEYALTAPVTFLGKSVKRYDEVVNAVCDHAACAPFIAGKLHKFFHGVDPSPTRRAELATIFRNANLEIRPLLEAILRDPMFFDPSLRLNRAKLPVEWVTHAFHAAGYEENGGWQASVANQLGQLPFYPPSVAGWPGGTRWLAAANALVRADMTRWGLLDEITNSPDMVGAALARCSVYEVSPATRAALTQVATSTMPKWQKSRLLLGLALCSPEHALA
jgi:uncharacterized protein (DUF1800 family)